MEASEAAAIALASSPPMKFSAPRGVRRGSSTDATDLLCGSPWSRRYRWFFTIAFVTITPPCGIFAAARRLRSRRSTRSLTRYHRSYAARCSAAVAARSLVDK